MTNTITTDRADFTLLTTEDRNRARRAADRFAVILDGKSYFDFRVEWGIGPTCEVSVSFKGTEADAAEAQGMALFLIADSVAL